MTIDDFKNKVALFKAQYLSNRARLALSASLDMTAAIKYRLQATGQDYNENKFKPYSPDYKKERNKKGFQTEYVDHTRTGRMLANVLPRIQANTKDATLIKIGANNIQELNKLRGQARYRGNILRPTKKESNAVAIQYGQAIARLINTNLG